MFAFLPLRSLMLNVANVGAKYPVGSEEPRHTVKDQARSREMTLGIRGFGSSDMIRDMEHIAQLIRVSSLHPECIVDQGDQFLAVIIAGLGLHE